MKMIYERINYREKDLSCARTWLFSSIAVEFSSIIAQDGHTINKVSILLGKRIGAFIHKFSSRNLYRTTTRTKSVLRIVLVTMRETNGKENIPPRLKLSHSFSAQTIHGQCPIHPFSLSERVVLFSFVSFSSKLRASCEGRVRRKVPISNRCLCPARNGGKEDERTINVVRLLSF